MIHDVRVFPLRKIIDPRGMVMHMLRRDDPHFEEFGEIYFSGVHQGAVKAWHLHHRMTLNYAVPHGLVRLVLYDQRLQSPTRGQVQEIEMGPDHYALVAIPPGIWNGFLGLAEGMSLVANCATIPHDPNEIDRLDPFDQSIPYQWESRHP